MPSKKKSYNQAHPAEFREVRCQVEAKIPMKQFDKPEETTHFVVTLMDGMGTSQTSQFFAIDGGWSFM